MTSYFFGCIDRPGHLFYDANLRPAGVPREVPFGRADGQLTPVDDTSQGAAVVRHKDGWTALAVHDYTVDSDVGACAVFFLEAPELSFHAAVTEARRAYPDLVARIGPLRPTDPPGGGLSAGAADAAPALNAPPPPPAGTAPCPSPWHKTRVVKRADRCPLCGERNNDPSRPNG